MDFKESYRILLLLNRCTINKNIPIKLLNELQQQGIDNTVEKYNLIRKDDGQLTLLKYHQIDSSSYKGVKACQQARGIIINNETLEVVSISFDRFFNFGEKEAVAIDFDNAKVLKKEDGSLLTTYYYNGQWRVQTSGTIQADSYVGIYDFSFAELFWDTFRKNGGNISEMNKDYCYAFELCTIYNQVVAKHTEQKLVLLNVRNRNNYEELTYKQLCKAGTAIGIAAVKMYEFNSLEAVLLKKDTLHYQEEGYVIWDDKNHKRIKVKNQQYVVMHKAKGNQLDGSGIFTFIKQGETAELKAVYSRIADEVNEKEIWYHKTSDGLGVLYDECVKLIKQGVTRKEYALFVIPRLNQMGVKKLSSYFFGLFTGTNVNIIDTFHKQDEKILAKMFENKK